MIPNKVEYAKIIHSVFELDDFKRQLEEVKQKLPEYEPGLVEDVIKYHLLKTSEEVSKERPWKRRISIYTWGYIEVFHACYNQFSMYYNKFKTERSLKKHQKNLNNLI